MKPDAREALLASVYTADTDFRDLADRLGVDLSQLAAMAADPALAAAIDALASLAEQRARLLVARYRVNAAAQLVALVGQTDDAELSRKAAVDLLKLDTGGAVLPASDAAPGPLDTRAVLGALASLGDTTAATPAGPADSPSSPEPTTDATHALPGRADPTAD